jgi:hypothetical protein
MINNDNNNKKKIKVEKSMLARNWPNLRVIFFNSELQIHTDYFYKSFPIKHVRRLSAKFMDNPDKNCQIKYWTNIFFEFWFHWHENFHHKRSSNRYNSVTYKKGTDLYLEHWNEICWRYLMSNAPPRLN